MTIINPKSISGVTSITTASGADNLLTIHTSDTAERLRINSSGDIIVGSGVTLSVDGHSFHTGVVTATTFSGSGASLTNLPAANITGTLPAISGANLTGIDTDLVGDTTPQLGGNLDVNTKNILFGDSGGATDDRLTFGAGTDLSIYHDGSHSRIVDSGTGNLILQTSKININNADGTEAIIHGTAGGAVEVYHANSSKLTTSASGVTVTGTVTAGAANLGTGDLTLTGNINLADSSGGGNNRIIFGAGDDFQLWHDGSHSYIADEGTGNLNILVSTANINNAANSENIARFIENGAVELYYNNVDVFSTTSDGIRLRTGSSSQISFYDVSTATIIIYTHSTSLRWWDDVNDDAIMELSQAGNLNIDGSYSNSGVDYAEYFESTDGSVIPVGTTVVLDSGKVRAATSSETPIGVIRPKTSGTSVTGGVNQLNWQGKYLVDDYDGQLMESGTHCTWTDANGDNQQCWKDRPPTGVTIPSDAVETTMDRPQLNPLFDASKTYVPRSERNEWNCVGLLGQIPITKGQPTSANWIKMKDRSATVELWMVK